MAWHMYSLIATKAASLSCPRVGSKGGDREMLQGEGQEQQEQHRELLHVPVLDGVCYQLLHVGWEWDPQTRTCSWIPAQPLGGSRSGSRQLLCLSDFSSIRMCCCLSLRCLPAHDEGASCSANNENYLFQIVLKKVSH